MSEIVEFYQQQAQNHLSNISWVAQLQTKALENLKQQGFPSRTDEEWKYTNVGPVLKQAFHSSVDTKSASIPESDILGKYRLCIRNGQFLGCEELSAQLPEQVIVLPLAEAVKQHPDLVKPHLGAVLKQEHGFHYLNTAMLQCGLFLYIPKGVVLEAPIILTQIQDQEFQAIHLRHLIIAEAESKAIVVEEYSGTANCCYLTNTVTEIILKEQAELDHYKIQSEGNLAYHVGHLAIMQAKQSSFNSHSLSVGGALVRSDLTIYLQDEGAHCLMNGIYAPTDGQQVDHHTSVHHLVPNCSSVQDYKGILMGRSKAVFNGKVLVAEQAQQSNAQQQNKNLLLSNEAEINTKPQLEIFADDVICSHGATVGQLDEDALFYLATRGISRAEASHYLIQAFAHNNLSYLAHPELAAWMSNLLTQQLG